MKLTLDRDDLKPLASQVNCSKTKFEHFKPNVQKAIVLVGRALFQEFDGRSYNAIHPPAEFLWIRLGINAEYERHDDLADVAGHLADFRVFKVEVAGKYAVESSAFQGHDNISLYYGDIDAQPIRSLKKKEITELNRRLKEIGEHELESAKFAGSDDSFDVH